MLFKIILCLYITSRVEIPNIYKSVFKEVCRADATAVELGKVNKYFYEFGLYLTRYDVNNIVGGMIFETCRQRSRFLSTITKSTTKDFSMDNRLDNIENQLYEMGCRSSRLVILVCEFCFTILFNFWLFCLVFGMAYD